MIRALLALAVVLMLAAALARPYPGRAQLNYLRESWMLTHRQYEDQLATVARRERLALVLTLAAALVLTGTALLGLVRPDLLQ